MKSKSNRKVSLKLKTETVSAWVFEATVNEEEKDYGFVIELNKNYYHELTGGNILPLLLAQESLFFLLQNEPPTSILSQFNIEQIKEYFPQFENEIKEILNS